MKSLFTGSDTLCPTLTTPKPYIYLDNGASTPSLKVVDQAIAKYMPYYSSVHRGTGFKSLLSTHLFEKARKEVLEFVNAHEADHVCIFTRNTTESINKLAKRFPFTKERGVVLTTAMEHHADDLPWRANAYSTVHVAVTDAGTLDLEDLQQKLQLHKGHVAMVAVTGASNVTGVINPIHKIAKLTHEAGALIFVDCAQLIAHRKVDMKRLDDPEHLDYIAFSGHKMYAPFGTGALVGRLDTFNVGEPDIQGGGAVLLVTLDTVVWTSAPDRDEAGSPNIPGAVALLAAIKQLRSIGMDYIAEHEAKLTAYALRRMIGIAGLKVLGDRDSRNTHARVGVIPFVVEGLSPNLVAAILGFEFGIGVRSGCFCAHPLTSKMLGIDDKFLLDVYLPKLKAGDSFERPGMVRISFGLYNDESDVDHVIAALILICSSTYSSLGNYEMINGDYKPVGWSEDSLDEYVDIDDFVKKSNIIAGIIKPGKVISQVKTNWWSIFKRSPKQQVHPFNSPKQ